MTELVNYGSRNIFTCYQLYIKWFQSSASDESIRKAQEIGGTVRSLRGPPHMDHTNKVNTSGESSESVEGIVQVNVAPVPRSFCIVDFQCVLRLIEFFMLSLSGAFLQDYLTDLKLHRTKYIPSRIVSQWGSNSQPPNHQSHALPKCVTKIRHIRLWFLQAVQKDGTPLCIHCQEPIKIHLLSKETVSRQAWHTKFCNNDCMVDYQVCTISTGII